MAWFPGAIRKEVTRHRTSLVLVNGRYRAVVFHIAVSDSASLFNYFNQPGNPTSHFYVRKTGVVEQYVDTQFRAPAQLEGNPTCISIETEGGTEAGCSGTWTAEQVNALTDLTVWLNQVGGLPLVAMPNSLPASVGVGYHRLGINPWRVSGGETWSDATGKECPCDHRIAQIPGILAAAQQGGDVPLTQAEIDQIAAATQAAVWARVLGSSPASTIMVRLDPGPGGIGPLIRDKSWEKITPDALTGADQTVLDLLRFAQGDARNAQTTLGAGGDVNTQLDRMETTLNAVVVPTAAEIATAVVALLQPGEITQAEVEAAIRNVMSDVWCAPPVTGV